MKDGNEKHSADEIKGTKHSENEQEHLFLAPAAQTNFKQPVCHSNRTANKSAIEFRPCKL